MLKSTIISFVVSIALVGGTFYLISDRSAFSNSEMVPSQNIEIKDGVQYVTIIAKGGYSPRVTSIKEGLPTKLVVKTAGTYDCSASLIVRSVGFQKILPPTGEEVIDLGILKSGEKVLGVCGMGMYSFQIKVN
ncbi:MAG: cupredoxin domain-containing protein [Candidatus Vogelbacteria bacterium]|nr:cupredoxin domain-containing protein [Candidatus Vogelbacteria bacterium]